MADEDTTVDTPGEDALTGEPAAGEETVDLLGQDGAPESEDAQPKKEDQLEAAPAEGHRSATLQKLIDEKYAGNGDALAKAYIEQQNSTAQVFRELKALREEMAVAKEKPEPETTEDDPDLSSLNDERALVVEELEALKSTHDIIVTSFNKLSEQKIRLETKIELADDYDKPKHQDALSSLEQQLAALKERFDRLPRESKRLTAQLTKVDRQIQSAKSAVQTRSQARKQQEHQDKELQGQFRSTVEQHITSLTKEKGIAEGTRVHARLGDYVRRSIIAHLSSLDPNGPGIDPAIAVQHFSEEFLEGLTEGAKASFKTASATKAAATSPPASKTQPGSRPVAVKELTRERIEAHKDAVLGA